MELWIPRSAQEKPRHVCRLCGARFFQGEEARQARHVMACFTAQENEIRSSSPRERAPGLFGTDGVDTEFMDWHRMRGAG